MRRLVLLALAAADLTRGEAPSFLRRTALSMCEMAPREGAVEDCRCDFETADDATSDSCPLLRDLTRRSFFRYFKVALDRPCPYWPDDGMCARRECAVESCADDEVPAPWLEAEPSGGDEVWIDQPDDESGMIYVDLKANPEGHTGYDGEPARRIWRAIYEENCFDLDEAPSPKEQLVLAWRRDVVRDTGAPSIQGQCLERRVFYKLVSGLQASISTHIATSDFGFWDVVRSAPADFRRRSSAFFGAFFEKCLPGEDTCAADAAPQSSPFVNDALFVDRVGGHRDRLDNLYFAYLFVLRAVTRAGAELVDYDYATGDAADDAMTAALVRRLVASEAAPLDARGDCAAADAARGFDETLLFAAPEDARMSPLERALAREHVDELRGQFLSRFRNVSQIMDCVTCERCRLWGKLQILGLGTALKILLADGDAFGLGVLQRNEVVALVNTLAQLAKSVDSIRAWQKRDVRRATAKMAALAGLGLVVSAVFARLAWRRARPKAD
ncbi:hypothetical protein JL721_3804 [Aureococcus anophagefferens]|nr:hypothetical protein JL721_3804 [Aureococcus anophagefferens]